MEHLLLSAIAIFATAGTWVVSRAGVKTAKSVSLHAAQTRQNLVVFGGLVLLATGAMAIVIYGWLLPLHQANVISYIVFSLLLLGLVVAALIPHIEGTWREPIHNAAAWGMVYVIPLIMAFMLQWSLSSVAWATVAVLTVINSILLLIALLWYIRMRSWFLYFQLAYLAIFFASLLVVAYS